MRTLSARLAKTLALLSYYSFPIQSVMPVRGLTVLQSRRKMVKDHSGQPYAARGRHCRGHRLETYLLQGVRPGFLLLVGVAETVLHLLPPGRDQHRLKLLRRLPKLMSL